MHMAYQICENSLSQSITPTLCLLPRPEVELSIGLHSHSCHTSHQVNRGKPEPGLTAADVQALDAMLKDPKKTRRLHFFQQSTI